MNCEIFKDLNSMHFLSAEIYFEILDNAWSLWLALQQILFIWYQNEKLRCIKFQTISHNFCFVWWNLWHSPENFDKKKRHKWHLEEFAFKLWKLNHSKKIYAVISRLYMTSLSVDLHSPEVCKASSIVLKKQITKTYVKQHRFTYRSPRYTINYV